MKTVQATIQVHNQRIADRIEKIINQAEYEDSSTGFGGRVTVRPVDEETWAELGIEPVYEVKGALTVHGWITVGKIIESYAAQDPVTGPTYLFAFEESPRPESLSGARLKAIRESMLLTQTEFGRFLGGSSLRAVQDWESEKRSIPSTVIEILRLRRRL